MPHVELSADEYAVLHEVLSDRLAEIRREIHHTDTREFRMLLQRREDMLAGMVARLEHSAAGDAMPAGGAGVHLH